MPADLRSKAWFALAVLVALMGLLLFLPAGTVHYWQAWVYLSIFTGASVLTTLYLMREDPALLERRMSGGPTAEKRPVQQFIMLCTSIGFIALLVVPAFDQRFRWSARSAWRRPRGRAARRDRVLSHLPGVSRKHLHVGNHRSHRESDRDFDRPVRNRSPPHVRECVSVSPRHAAGAWLVVGVCTDRRDAAVSRLAAL